MLARGLVRAGLSAGLVAPLLGSCGVGELPKRAADAIGTGQVFGFSGLEGRWAGPVRPTDAACGPERHGLMRVGGGTFAFDPFGSTTVIDGTVKQDTLSGALSRQGGTHQTLTIGFEGTARVDPDKKETIGGTLKSGRCTWQVTLHRS